MPRDTPYLKSISQWNSSTKSAAIISDLTAWKLAILVKRSTITRIKSASSIILIRLDSRPVIQSSEISRQGLSGISSS